MKEIIAQLNNMIETYVDDSKIKEIIYNNETKKWKITYSYDVPADEFDSTQMMIEFLHYDQLG